MIFKQAFRVAFIALVWKQYKAVIVSTLLLLAYLFIVSSIHKDYLAAVGPDDINQVTFVYKWLAYIIGLIIYFGFHSAYRRFGSKKASANEKISQSKELTDTDQDPFAAIRERKTLRSRADFLIGDENKKE